MRAFSASLVLSLKNSLIYSDFHQFTSFPLTSCLGSILVCDQIPWLWWL